MFKHQVVPRHAQGRQVAGRQARAPSTSRGPYVLPKHVGNRAFAHAVSLARAALQRDAITFQGDDLLATPYGAVAEMIPSLAIRLRGDPWGEVFGQDTQARRPGVATVLIEEAPPKAGARTDATVRKKAVALGKQEHRLTLGGSLQDKSLDGTHLIAYSLAPADKNVGSLSNIAPAWQELNKVHGDVEERARLALRAPGTKVEVRAKLTYGKDHVVTGGQLKSSLGLSDSEAWGVRDDAKVSIPRRIPQTWWLRARVIPGAGEPDSAAASSPSSVAQRGTWRASTPLTGRIGVAAPQVGELPAPSKGKGRDKATTATVHRPEGSKVAATNKPYRSAEMYKVRAGLADVTWDQAAVRERTASLLVNENQRLAAEVHGYANAHPDDALRALGSVAAMAQILVRAVSACNKATSRDEIDRVTRTYHDELARCLQWMTERSEQEGGRTSELGDDDKGKEREYVVGQTNPDPTSVAQAATRPSEEEEEEDVSALSPVAAGTTIVADVGSTSARKREREPVGRGGAPQSDQGVRLDADAAVASTEGEERTERKRPRVSDEKAASGGKSGS